VSSSTFVRRLGDVNAVGGSVTAQLQVGALSPSLGSAGCQCRRGRVCRSRVAVQLARHAGAEVVESGPVDLVFDTRGGEIPAGERVVTIVEEVSGATYFVVEPDHEQLLELAALVDAGELRPAVDSVFPLTQARAAFERVAAPGKRGKVVLEVGSG
jgi:Zinc-binding dehydrogenase